MRDSLLVLLRAIPQVGVIHQAVDGKSALSMSPRICPTLVLLDCDLQRNGGQTSLRQLKAEWPWARCVALVDNEQECQSAQAVGMDVVLMKGVLAARLFEVIEGLIQREAKEQEVLCV
jgi:DNA-binding NarL/FixJ family response regulator